MIESPPSTRDVRKEDPEQLRILGIFHFVVAGLAFLGVGLLCAHYTTIHALLAEPIPLKAQPAGGPSTGDFFGIFKWFYLMVGTLALAGGFGNLLSGLLIFRRKLRIFSLIMAAVNCTMVPLGTVLGVFTIVVLLRPSVREAYQAPSHT
jgi:hypothetical protein